MHQTPIILLLLFAMHLISRAAEERKIAFRTLCLEQVKGIEKVVIPIADGTKSTEVPLYTDVSPELQAVFPSNEAAFYRQKTGPDGKPMYELMGKATMGKSSRQLFLFLPSGKGEGQPPYQVRCFDDDTTAFAMGHIRAINLSPVPVRFVVSGTTSPEMAPGRYAQFPHSKKVNEYNMYPVVVEFRSATGEWVKGQSVSWKSTNLRREIVITQIDPRFKQPVVKMYTDFPPWLEPVPAEGQP